jgi:hypothetical protein
LRALPNPYIEDWEKNRQVKAKELKDRRIVPVQHELDKLHQDGKLTEQIGDDTIPRYLNTAFLREVQ